MEVLPTVEKKEVSADVALRNAIFQVFSLVPADAHSQRTLFTLQEKIEIKLEEL